MRGSSEAGGTSGRRSGYYLSSWRPPGRCGARSAGPYLRAIHSVRSMWALTASRVRTAIAGGAAVLACACGAPHTSDAQMAKLFHAHKIEYDTIVEMLKEDPSIEGIRPGVIWDGKGRSWSQMDTATPDRRLALPDDRARRYQDLLNRLNLDLIGRADNGSIDFRLDSPSIQNGDSQKGIEYSEGPLEPLLPSLDGLRRPRSFRGEHYLIHKLLEPRWYLYLFIN